MNATLELKFLCFFLLLGFHANDNKILSVFQKKNDIFLINSKKEKKTKWWCSAVFNWICTKILTAVWKKKNVKRRRTLKIANNRWGNEKSEKRGIGGRSSREVRNEESEEQKKGGDDLLLIYVHTLFFFSSISALKSAAPAVAIHWFH